MMAGLLLLACAAAGCVAGFILFVLYGPLPGRSLLIAPRIAAVPAMSQPIRMVQPIAVAPTMFVDATVRDPRPITLESVVVQAVEPPKKVAPPPVPRQKKKDAPFVAPPPKKLPVTANPAFTPVVRKAPEVIVPEVIAPANAETIAPLPRTRSARGTGSPTGFTDELPTAGFTGEVATAPFRTDSQTVIDNGRTEQVPTFDADELTAVEEIPTSDAKPTFS